MFCVCGRVVISCLRVILLAKIQRDGSVNGTELRIGPFECSWQFMNNMGEKD